MHRRTPFLTFALILLVTISSAQRSSSNASASARSASADTPYKILKRANVGGQGAAVDPQSGHGFTSSKPVSMFDTKAMKPIKTIDVNPASQPDGIYFDAFNERVYVFSHPTKDATVIDVKDGTVLGTIDLGGVPEQGVSDGKGTLYVVMQDAQGASRWPTSRR